jgi:hypothetical protein
MKTSARLESKPRLHSSPSALAVALSLVLGAGLISGCGEQLTEEFPDMGSESGAPTQRNFAYLINNYRQAKGTPTPWAGYWWPYLSNGIANGSYGGGKSPAGKYDAARGLRGNPTQTWELKEHGAKVPKVEGWWGHCNGWSAAAALFAEPREDKVSGGIVFTVADQKALLSEAAMEVNADFFGERTDPWDHTPWKVSDTVPNQFFLVLTNYLGRKNHPVLIDRYTYGQVWNQPMVAYRFDPPKREDYLGPDPQAPGVHRMMVTATIWWASDAVAPATLTDPFEWKETLHFDERTLRAELWLDGPVVFGADGKVASSGNLIVTRHPQNPDRAVGGAWRTGENSDAWPDYMWVPHSVFTRDSDAPINDPYANPFVDIRWLTTYMLKGQTDPSATPQPVDTAPEPEPTRTATPTPTSVPTAGPIPTPSG